MKRYIQHEYLKVSHFVSKEWQHPVHNHNHFELIFVHRGKGMHHVADMHYAYEGKGLFLLAPCDAHYFTIEEETEFTFVKFTNVYLHGAGNAQLQQDWNQEVDDLLVRARRQEGALLPVTADLERLDGLMHMISAEWYATKSERNETLFFLVQALFSVIRRNVNEEPVSEASPHAARLTAIVHYLHEHIYTPDCLQVDHLAEVFAYSKHYLGTFFKDHMGVSLRDYVNEYKVRLIESRLRYGSLSLKEISQDFGFTDLSHFNKFFRNMKGMSPSAFRKTVVAPAS